MNDRDILRHDRHDRLDRLDRVNTFGIENLANLPAGCEAITRFANLTTISGKLNGFKVGQVRGPASLQALLDALWLDFKDIARTARAIDLDEPGFIGLIEGTQEVTRLDAMMQNLYRRNPAKLHAWLAASRVERSPKRKKAEETPAAGTTTPPAPQS